MGNSPRDSAAYRVWYGTSKVRAKAARVYVKLASYGLLGMLIMALVGAVVLLFLIRLVKTA